MSGEHTKPAAEAPAAKRAKVEAAATVPAAAAAATAAVAPAAAASSSSAAAAAAAAFTFPSDWPPASGPIDLTSADLPHDSADTEWWYINGHATAPDSGHELSFFASFFRIVKSQDAQGKLEHAHALNWAIVDVTAGTYHADPILDRATPDILRKQLADGTYDLDSRMSRAFMEVVNKGNVPLPDRMFDGEIAVSKDALNLRYAENTFHKTAEGHYAVHCECAAKGISLTLDLTPLKQPYRQAHEGVVKIGLKQDTMFYYYIPRNAAQGTIKVNGKTHTVVGEAWYDHEFGGEIKESKRKETGASAAAAAPTLAPAASANGKRAASASASSSNGVIGHTADAASTGVVVPLEVKKSKAGYAWNWLSCQLDDGSDITATTLLDTSTGVIEDNFAIVTGPVATGGVRTEYLSMELKPLASWTSIRTTNDYPTHWALTIPGANIELDVKSVFDNQEMITLISKPAFWEGRVNLTGTIGGRKVTGKGFVERHGFTSMSSLDSFFKRISKQVMEQIDMVMPLKPNYNQTRELLASAEFDHFMDGVSIDVFTKTIVTPLREIIDRGGKSWRSFAFLLCIDCVGGQSTKYKHWLAMPEMMHVGSLIVDDIQDKSEIRRGGPSCHMVHGDAIAINAGTAAYFLSLHILQSLTPDLDVATRCRLYEIYFLTLRAGHCGQAFDIYGLDYLMSEAVKTGDSTRLEKSVMCTHRLKSAVPAGCLARMGALVGGGSQVQIDRVGMYMEAIGLAFQIIDDVLNLKGFENNVKDRGEDIKAGKVTFPVAKAMSSSRLDLAARTQLWESIKAKPQDVEVVGALIQRLDECGAIDASIDEANTLVKDAWAEVDAVIPDSFYKMLLRAFGWYVLERHY